MAAATSQVPPVHETLADVDSHIARLKDKVEQLRKTLQHWQTWDAEYEALKEEVQALPDTPPAEELQRIQADFGGELLVGKELDEIFSQKQRSRDQIVNILDRRIDYVSQNVRSLQTQLDKAELDHLNAEASNEQGAVDENGPPITEIVEQLDDKDNVVSFRLSRPGEALPRVRAALEKAGIEDPLPDSGPSDHKQDTKTVSVTEKEPAKKNKESLPLSTASQPTQEPTPQISRAARRVEDIMRTAKEQEKISSQPAVLPEDEDEDDAALRQQMLKYSMGEMGAVVAELNLEEDDDDDDNDDFDDDEWLEGDEDLDDDDDDQEDRFGRFTGRMITDKYQRRMLELETRLGVKSRFTQKQEQEAEEKDSDDDGEGIGRIRIKTTPTSPTTSSAAPTKSIVREKNISSNNEPKKGVRFANELDIAPESEPTAPALPTAKPDSPDVVEPMSDLIVERAPAPRPTAHATAPAMTRKPSRFKKAMAANTTQPTSETVKGPLDVPSSFLAQHPQDERPPVPTGPEGMTIADTLVEKQNVSRPADPSELDDAMAHMGIAEEHQRLRNRFIQRDGGGFLCENEEPVQSLNEAEGGERISRFKAARLSRQ